MSEGSAFEHPPHVDDEYPDRFAAKLENIIETMQSDDEGQALLDDLEQRMRRNPDLDFDEIAHEDEDLLNDLGVWLGHENVVEMGRAVYRKLKEDLEDDSAVAA